MFKPKIKKLKLKIASGCCCSLQNEAISIRAIFRSEWSKKKALGLGPYFCDSAGDIDIPILGYEGYTKDSVLEEVG